MLWPITNPYENIMSKLWRRMKKGMWISGERWYIHCGGCGGLWRKMVLMVLHVWCGVVWCHLILFIGVELLDGLCVWVEV